MGFVRKATFVATGGASGLVFKANSKKERIAKAAERQAAGEQRAMRAQEDQGRRDAIAAGSWWLDTSSFKGVRSFANVRYLGGWPGQDPVAKAGKMLQLKSNGLQFSGTFKTLFTVPWERVQAVEVEDANVSDHRGVADVLVEGKPASLLTLTVQGGPPVLFLLRKEPETLGAKFAPMVERLRSGRERAVRVGDTHGSSVPATGVAISVADELAKFAQLRDSGVLSEEEFTAQKSKLLS